MTSWKPDELSRIGAAEELRLAARRADDTHSAYTTMWVVCVGDQLFVRSAYGPGSAWYRRARTARRGCIRAGGIERDVSFVEVPATETATHEALDTAYHAKYDQYGARIVGSVVGPRAATVTIRLEPQH